MADSDDRIAADILIAALGGESSALLSSGVPKAAERAKAIAEAFQVIYQAVAKSRDY